MPNQFERDLPYNSSAVNIDTCPYNSQWHCRQLILRYSTKPQLMLEITWKIKVFVAVVNLFQEPCYLATDIYG